MSSTALAHQQNGEDPEIRTRPCPECFLCGAAGDPLYSGLTDRLFDAPGVWNLKRCPNPECGLIWLDPMPLEDDIGKAYVSYFTHAAPENAPAPPLPLRSRIAARLRSGYRGWRFNYGPDARNPFRFLLALPIILTRIECDGLDIPLRYLAVPKKGRLLDVGCGDGSVVKLAAEIGWNAEGVDFDPAAVANARSKGLSVRLGALEDQRYPGNSFDLVLMSHVIEHVPDPLRTLREIRRVLRSGGALVVTTPNADSSGSRRFGASWVHLDPPRHLHLFNGRSLATLAAKAELATRRLSSSVRMTAFTFLASRSIQKAGRAGQLRVPRILQALYGRIGTVGQLAARSQNPIAADELIIEAEK